MYTSQLAEGRDKMVRVVDMTIEYLNSPKGLIEGVLSDENIGKAPAPPSPWRRYEMFLSYAKASDDDLANWAKLAALKFISLAKTETEYASLIDSVQGFKDHLLALKL